MGAPGKEYLANDLMGLAEQEQTALTALLQDAYKIAQMPEKPQCRPPNTPLH